MKGFRKIDPHELKVNPFTLVLKDWFLVTAGDLESFNTMTAGWGGLIGMWSRNCVLIAVRPTRYTFEFLERNEYFTLCWLGSQYRKALEICGSVSGRHVNKVADAGLHPIQGSQEGMVAFKEAELIMECRKIYFQDITPANFQDDRLEDWYPEKDYHRFYIGEILNCFVK